VSVVLGGVGAQTFKCGGGRRLSFPPPWVADLIRQEQRPEGESPVVRNMSLKEQVDRAFTHARRRSLILRMRARLRKGRAFHRAEELPPVSLNKVGEKYFVVDGNYRDAVARHQGVESIDAEVIVISSRMPIGQMFERECEEM
jgi:hypothetical protein